MLKFTSLQVRHFLPVILALLVLPALTLVSKTVEASALTTDLQALVVQGNNVNTQLSAMSLNADTSCSQLGSAITSVESFTAAVNSVSGNLSAPISVDADSLAALDNLTILSAGIAATLPVLSSDISLMSVNTSMADIQAALDAMLKLSDDIGTMADRILEMADKILVMADNIGAMADRILLTQQIQSTNIALTQSFILTTQQNMIALSPTVDTSAYNLPLNNLISTGSLLSIDMNNTQLTESNMSTELAVFESRVKDYLNSTLIMSELMKSDSNFASYFISGDTLTQFADLSVINAALADSINRYASSVNALAPDTNITVLNDAVNSMLRLAGDIGLMGNRMVEMGDSISVMADNIGLMSLRIIDTQTLQQSNLNLTQANLSSAQITTISVIAAFGL